MPVRIAAPESWKNEQAKNAISKGTKTKKLLVLTFLILKLNFPKLTPFIQIMSKSTVFNSQNSSRHWSRGFGSMDRNAPRPKTPTNFSSIHFSESSNSHSTKITYLTSSFMASTKSNQLVEELSAQKLRFSSFHWSADWLNKPTVAISIDFPRISNSTSQN